MHRKLTRGIKNFKKYRKENDMQKKVLENIIKKYNDENPQCNLSSEGTHSSLAKYIIEELQMNDYYIVSDYDLEMMRG